MKRNHPLKLPVMALSISLLGQAAAAHAIDDSSQNPHHGSNTPIKHVIVIIGENHTFDNLYGGYKPRHGQTVDNLLSKGIINADGTPGPNFSKAAQQQASNLNSYSIDPVLTGAYASLPQPQTTYATGLPPGVADVRFPANLKNGPFQITKYVPYSAYLGDPMHRFFQMWQQTNKGKMDLFVWANLTAGIGPQNGAHSPTPGHTSLGGESMGFYNMSTGDAPSFKALADNFAISDNYHQSIMGGTGANFIAIATGDVAFHNLNGVPDVPPANQIENPDPQPGTIIFISRMAMAAAPTSIAPILHNLV